MRGPDEPRELRPLDRAALREAADGGMTLVPRAVRRSPAKAKVHVAKAFDQNQRREARKVERRNRKINRR